MTSNIVVRGLRHQVVNQLRDEILSGRFSEGEALREVEIAKRFDTSRGPVREALMQLTHEGYLTAKPNCGVRVAALSTGYIHDLVVPLRRMVETYALRAIYDQLGESDFQTWELILDGMLRACEGRDFVSIAERDIAFHRSIVERAGLSDLTSIWSTLVSRVRRHFQETHARYSDPLRIHEEHAAIITVFQKGNLDDSIEALAENIQ